MEHEKIRTDDGGLNFKLLWTYLDNFRGALFRSAAGIFVCMIVVFINRHIVFDVIIFGPASSDFLLYQWLCKLGEQLSMPSLCIESFSLRFQNITVSGQFFSHISTSFWFGLALAFPWIVYQFWRCIKPLLPQTGRSTAGKVLTFSFLLLVAGMLTGYFFVLPLAARFLGLYQVADAVHNITSLTSYVDTFVMLVIGMGLAFQMPVIILILSRIGILHRSFLTKYRRHAIVIIVTIMAIITPTPDPMTMTIASIPLLLLYEFSIFICRK